MGNHANNAEADPKAVEDAQGRWGNFTVLMKYSILGVIVILSGMALFLL